MNRDEAVKYLNKKGYEATEEEVEKVMKQGKIYGDPVANCI